MKLLSELLARTLLIRTLVGAGPGSVDCERRRAFHAWFRARGRGGLPELGCNQPHPQGRIPRKWRSTSATSGLAGPGPVFTTATFIGLRSTAVAARWSRRTAASRPRSSSLRSPDRGFRASGARRRRGRSSTASTSRPWRSWRPSPGSLAAARSRTSSRSHSRAERGAAVPVPAQLRVAGARGSARRRRALVAAMRRRRSALLTRAGWAKSVRFAGLGARGQ